MTDKENLVIANEEIVELKKEIRGLKGEIIDLSHIVADLRQNQKATLLKLDRLQETLTSLVK